MGKGLKIALVVLLLLIVAMQGVLCVTSVRLAASVRTLQLDHNLFVERVYWISQYIVPQDDLPHYVKEQMCENSPHFEGSRPYPSFCDPARLQLRKLKNYGSALRLLREIDVETLNAEDRAQWQETMESTKRRIREIDVRTLDAEGHALWLELVDTDTLLAEYQRHQAARQEE